MANRELGVGSDAGNIYPKVEVVGSFRVGEQSSEVLAVSIERIDEELFPGVEMSVGHIVRKPVGQESHGVPLVTFKQLLDVVIGPSVLQEPHTASQGQTLEERLTPVIPQGGALNTRGNEPVRSASVRQRLGALHLPGTGHR